MSNVKISKAAIDQFFKEHKDAAAVFVLAGLAHEEIESAICKIQSEEIKPGSRKGYESVVRQVLKQRETNVLAQDSTVKATGGKAERNPVIYRVADSDPRKAGIPWREGEHGQTKIRIVDPAAMVEKLEAEKRDMAAQDVKMSYVYSLGLGKPRILKSPTKLQLDKLFQLQARFPHFREVIKRLHASLHARMLGSAPTKFSPLLIHGGAGLGKTELISCVAAALEIDCHSIASAASDPIALCGLGFPWKGARPGKVAFAMASRTEGDEAANCIFFIDEIDKAAISGRSDVGSTTSFFDQLLSALESPHLFYDSYFGEKAAIHVGACSWIFAANNLENIPDYFRTRLEIFKIDSPKLDDWKSGGLLKSIFQKVLSSAPYAPFFVSSLSDEVTDLLAGSGQTPREIRQALELALERALSRFSEPPEAGSVWLSPEDFSFPVATKKRPIGFHAEVCK